MYMILPINNYSCNFINSKNKISFKADIKNLQKTINDVDRYTKTMTIDLGDLIWAKEVLFRAPMKSIILDVGSNNGDLCRELRKINPMAQTINLDLSAQMHTIAKKKDVISGLTKNTTYIVGNAFDIPVKDESLNVIICNRVLHEIYSYASGEHGEKAFSKDSIQHFFKHAYKKLAQGGQLLINDCCPPENPNELCTITNFKVGKNLSDKEILNCDIRYLNDYNLLKRFCIEFEPAKGLYCFKDNEKKCIMPKWLLEEFIRHRKFNDTIKHWNDEINESYCATSMFDCMEFGENAGFIIKQCGQGAKGGEQNFYHFTNKDFKIYDFKGKTLDESDFPQHYHIILQKKYHSWPKCSLLD